MKKEIETFYMMHTITMFNVREREEERGEGGEGGINIDITGN